MTLYQERQVGNYCRKHSINNLIGREIVTTTEFDQMCDEFDRENRFDTLCSRNQHVYYNYGDRRNIFGYIMERKGIRTTITGYDNWRKDAVDLTTDLEDILGAFVFRDGHVWCVRRYQDKWYLIDSMGGGPSITNESYFNNKQYCFLVVRRELVLPFQK